MPKLTEADDTWCYRRVIAEQARLFAKTLLGELPAYPPFKAS